MSQPLKLRILIGDHPAFEIGLTDPLLLGRQRKGDPGPYTLLPATAADPARVVIASATEENCSRQHVLLQPQPDGLVRVINGSRMPLARGDGGAPLPADAQADLPVPFSLLVGPRTLVVGHADSADEFGVQALEGQTMAPGALTAARGIWSIAGQPRSMSDETVGWLQSTINVLQSAVGSADFLSRSAAALVEIVGLHTGRVLLRQGEVWMEAAAAGTAAKTAEWRPSQQVLDRVRAQRRTFLKPPAQAGPSTDSPSLQAALGVVAAPLLEAGGEVIGALYGERHRGGSPPIYSAKVEALLVELLACGVSAGLARQEHQQAAIKARVQFEQFFGKELAELLRREPALLEGREADVTLLFCDVRGFSRASEKLGPAGTVKWINDVMAELSRCVLAEGGVLVDYIGDELLAMWGAPQPQPDQAARAARAALAMRTALAPLNARWRETLGGPMDVGVGLNTGSARVGNTGSEYKFKYGPLGNAVNLASRVQGLTKYLKCRVLATANTREQLGSGFISRRVCKARVVNIQEPVDLYEVEAAGSGDREEFFRSSEAALDALERGEFALAARRSGALVEVHPDDGPLLLVLSRATTMLVNGGAFDPMWEPPGK
jgi:adenylate cyclase